MSTKFISLALCLAMVAVAFIAMPFVASANGLPETIDATVRIEPETLNLVSQGVFTVFIALPEGYDVANIDVSTVECEGAPAVEGIVAGDEFIAKFNRQDLGVDPGDAVELTVEGELNDGTEFVGSDIIRVIDIGGQ